jgi:(2Fe-2S) ferredoxin
MREEELTSKIELHICNHSRDEKEACAALGSKDLSDELKKWAKSEHKGEIKIIRSGCLGKCSEGIAMACYPDKKLLVEVTKDDADEIKRYLEKKLKRL